MGDYSELKRAAGTACSYNESDWFTPENLAEMVEHEDAVFISAASPFVVSALIAENEQAKFIGRLAYNFDGYKAVLEERDQLKAENEALRKDYERLVFCTSHPEQQFFQGESGWGVMDCADGLSIPFKDAECLRSAIDRVMSKESGHD